MGVQMSESDVREFLAAGHTGVLVTQDPDGPGMPVPVWYWHDGQQHVYLSSPIRAAKVKRVRERPRVSFLVESGKAWVDLKAVVIDGSATVHESGPVYDAAMRELDDKYADYRLPPDALPGPSRDKYAVRVIIAIHIDRVRVSWDNSKIRLPVKT